MGENQRSIKNVAATYNNMNKHQNIKLNNKSRKYIQNNYNLLRYKDYKSKQNTA